MKLRRGHSAGANARTLLPKLAKQYFEAGRKAFHDKTPSEDLHRFRIATKRFRYTLELFQPVYGPGLERFLRELRELQTMLGAVSDYQSIGALVASDKALQSRLQEALKRKRNELRQQWRAFDTDGQLKRWKTYLSSGHSPR